MNASMFVITCTPCQDNNIRYRVRETCQDCADDTQHRHQVQHPGHVTTRAETIDTPMPKYDARTSRLTTKRGRW